ncbi:hypothetical protein GE061_016920 [Apolygus lucorum]|uniref:Uncharacterized protein n=1 Tax=Apolygus lucorum TaxID=248454 RepID=A0A6A4J808_APOLU|nr:hypothetical protein GE061_016920 [Apolygus lucorum]
MDNLGSQPKLALFLSLTLMNVVAVGICIYGPSPKERRSSQGRKTVTIKKRRKSVLSETSNVATAQEDEVKNQTAVLEEVSPTLPPIVEAEMEEGDGATTQNPTSPRDEQEINEINLSELSPEQKMENESSSPPDEQEINEINLSELSPEQKMENEQTKPPEELDANENNLSVITINENFDINRSSEEGSDISLNDMCGHGAEMRHLPQNVGKSVTAVISKSFQLIDTFNTRVIPAVENFNEQISKTARLEKRMDASIVGTINSSICPAVIRISDSINRMHEKINRVTENINRTNEPKERSVSCQVSDTLLGSSVGLKKSFFCPNSQTSEARIMNLFGLVSLKLMSRPKNRPTFKTLATQCWANRKRILSRKFRKTRSNDQYKPEKNTKGNHGETVAVGSCDGTFYRDNLQLSNFQEINRKDIIKEEVITVNPKVNNEEIHTAIELKQESSLEVPGRISSKSNFCGFPSLPSQLPSYLSSSADDFDLPESSSKLEEPLRSDFQSSPNFLDLESVRIEQSGNDEKVFQDSSSSVVTESKNTSLITVSELRDTTENARQRLVESGSLSDTRRNKSLHLSPTVQNTVERLCGSLRPRGGLQEVLDNLDSDLERNTVENLFVLILKIFEAWSDSQLTIVPSKALSHLSPSESSYRNTLSMNSKSVEPSEVTIGCLTKNPSPNYYSCSETLILKRANSVNEVSDTFTFDEEPGSSKDNDIVDEALSRTPECTEIEVSRSRQCLETPSSTTVMNNLEHNLKEVLYKEQYSLARKIASDCIDTALSTSEYLKDVSFSHLERTGSTTPVNTMRLRVETKDSASTLYESSEESFYSWAPGSSSDDYSYHECDGSASLLESSEKSMKKEKFDERGWKMEKDKCTPSSQDVKEIKSVALFSNLSSPGSAVVLKSSSIESWMLNSTSGDGVEIRNCHSELKSEEMSDLSSRPISFTTIDDTSESESSHSLADTTASESSKDVHIRNQRSSRLFNKMKKKRPKTPKNTVAGSEAPLHAQSDCVLKVAESFVNRNASLSDEN